MSPKVNFRHKTKGMVTKTFHGQMYFTADDCTYVLDEIPIRAEHSETFDLPVEKITKVTPAHIPANDHPWRQTNFSKRHKYIARKFHLEIGKSTGGTGANG